MLSFPLIYLQRAIYIIACVCLLINPGETLAQLSSEAIVDMMRSRDGEQCIYTNSEGQKLAIETVGDIILKAALNRQQTKTRPWNVTNGIRNEIRVIGAVPLNSISNTDDIDFVTTKAVFMREDKSTLSKQEAKTLLESNSSLIADVYNAKDGVVSEYIIKSRPAPTAFRMHPNGTSKQLDNSDPRVSEMIKRMNVKELSSNEASTNILKPNAPMPNFEITDINGKQWKMSELREKILVINFWFVECPPCIHEIPALNALMKEYATNSNVVFLSFANSSKDKITKFLATKPFTYNHIAQEQAEKVLTAWDIKFYPTNIVVNKGTISSSFTGGVASKSDNTEPTQHPMYMLINSEIKKCLAQ